MSNRRNRDSSGPKEPAAAAPPRLVGWKLWCLRLASAVLVPLLILVFIELLLRLAGFGHPTAFLIPSQNHGQKTLVQNNAFGWRFFGKRKSRAPAAISILQKKPPGTIRIFVFGESAAFGDPQPAFGLPRVLQAMLSLRHPELHFEVVNASMTAINSHVILPIARDCARADGDIWVVYMGNNEYVGPFGAGTVFGAQALPVPLVRANLALKSTRLGQLIDSAAEQWHASHTPADKSEWGGMLMFLDQQVPNGDLRISTVCRSFEKNLRDIIRAGHDSGAGVVVSTVAVNLKDCAPFASQHHAELTEAEKSGIQAQNAGMFSEAVSQFEKAAKLDDSNAELHFRLGRCQLALQDFADAQKELSKARDLDTLRFRCDSRLNEIIRKTARGHEAERVLLADAENSFATSSSNGVPGWDLFYEHVHLTFEGNYLLARTVAEQVEKLLPKNTASNSRPCPTINECAQRLGRTSRDLKSALAEIISRLTDPPFVTQINHDEQMQLFVREAREAEAGAGPNEALNVARAAVKASPDDAQLYEQVATLEQAAGHPDEFLAAAQRAVDLLPSDTEYWSQLGFAFVQQKKFTEAADAYHHAFDLNPEEVSPLQNMAMSLAKAGRNEEAMREYKHALAITPRFGLAWLGLGQLLEGMGRKAEAEECYQKAVQNRIHRAPELATLARFCMTRGWFEAASTNYDEAMKLNPTDGSLALECGQAHFLRGSELGKAGQSAAAAREFREAVRMMPDVIEARLNLGIALYRQGLLDESLHEFEQVAARSPTNSVARGYMDLIHKGLATH